MNKMIAALLLALAGTALVTGVPTLAQKDTLTNATADKADDEVQALVKKVYPAFVLIGGGSGVCISDDGYFLTNHHVWTDAVRPSQRSVKMAGNSRRFTADSVGADPRGDIVLGKLQLGKDEKVPFVELGDSDKLMVGDICLSIGNPFLLAGTGTEPTVTLGTVTATHRFQGGYSDAIQIDTAINPGNSGGPSFNIDGQVIGINGRNIASHGKRFNTGAGFAIPSNQIRNFMEAFKAQSGGAHIVRHGLVGGLNLDAGYVGGARIESVEVGSEGHNAGFTAGDLIVEIDGFEIPNALRYYGVIGTKPRGSTFNFKVKRGDKVENLEAANDLPVEVNQFPTTPSVDDGRSDRPTRRNRFRRGGGGGFNPFPLPAPQSTLADGFEYKLVKTDSAQGFEVTAVPEDSGLRAAGVSTGDILLELNGRRLMHYCDYNDPMIAIKPGTEVEIKFLSAGRERTAKLNTVKP